MIKFLHELVSPVYLPPIPVLDLIDLPDHPLLLELDFTLIHTHVPLAQLLYPELLPICHGLGLINTHLLHKVGTR